MNNLYFKPKDLLLLLFPLIVGVVCISIWLYEMIYVVGWKGYAWIRDPLMGIYPITFLIVMAYLLPQLIVLKFPKIWFVAYTVILFVASIGAYFAAQGIFIELYKCRAGLINCQTDLVAWSIWKLFWLVGVLSVIYFIPIRHFHHSTDGMHILTILVAFVSVVPTSLISLEEFHAWSEDSVFLFVDCVKMGYPALWTPILLGTLSTAAAKEWI